MIENRHQLNDRGDLSYPLPYAAEHAARHEPVLPKQRMRIQRGLNAERAEGDA